MEIYVLDSGPLSGTSTILDEIKKSGKYHTIEEIATPLIEIEREREEKDPKYVGNLPENDIERFEHLVFLVQRIREENEYADKRIKKAFQVRSKITPSGYLESYGIEIPGEWDQYIKKANYTRVFMFELIPKKYHHLIQEKELNFRKDLHRAEDIQLSIYRQYKEWGIPITGVPFFGFGPEAIKNRVKFILESI